MHNIATINGKEAMAYQGEMPWHRLGTKMDGTPDVLAALKAASLDWNVGLQPIQLVGGNIIEGKQAVVRNIDSQIMGIVTDEYNPLQNAEAFGVLQSACDNFGVTIDSAGALGIGQKCWMLAKLPESVEVVAGDRVDGYFLVITGHNGAIPFSARPTPIRVVCENTLSVAEAAGTAVIKLNHIKSDMENMKHVEKLINRLIRMLKVTGETFTTLADKKLTAEEVKNYINAVLSIDDTDTFIQEALGISAVETAITKRRDRIFNLVWTGKGAELVHVDDDHATAWGAYNAIVEYYDHVRPSEFKKDSAIAKANKSAILGANSRIKAQALSFALTL